MNYRNNPDNNNDINEMLLAVIVLSLNSVKIALKLDSDYVYFNRMRIMLRTNAYETRTSATNQHKNQIYEYLAVWLDSVPDDSEPHMRQWPPIKGTVMMTAGANRWHSTPLLLPNAVWHWSDKLAFGHFPNRCDNTIRKCADLSCPAVSHHHRQICFFFFVFKRMVNGTSQTANSTKRNLEKTKKKIAKWELEETTPGID